MLDNKQSHVKQFILKVQFYYLLTQFPNTQFFTKLLYIVYMYNGFKKPDITQLAFIKNLTTMDIELR